MQERVKRYNQTGSLLVQTPLGVRPSLKTQTHYDSAGELRIKIRTQHCDQHQASEKLQKTHCFTQGISILIQKINKNYQNSRVSNFYIHKTFNFNRKILSDRNSRNNNNSHFSQNYSRLSKFKDFFLQINIATKLYKIPIITWFLKLEILITVIHWTKYSRIDQRSSWETAFKKFC